MKFSNYSKKGFDSAQKGQKLQSTVRFEPSTFEELEDISENSGVSFSEAVRRTVRKGLQERGEI
jgi:hypothetical protein